MSKRAWWTLLAFVLFILGSVSLALNLVGLKFSFLAWIDAMGQLPAFVIKLSMIIGGIVIAILASSNEDAYDEYFDGDKYKIGDER